MATSALALFEMDWDSFLRLPSRLTAESALRGERERQLAQVTHHGCISDYAGVRVSATGRRFRIKQTVVWNLVDEGGDCHGQAAAFDR